MPTFWWYPYIEIVVGLACSKGPESYAAGSIAAGRASHVRQVITRTKRQEFNKSSIEWLNVPC